MDPATLIGIVLAVVSLLTLMIMEGSSPMAIVLIPPLILVFGGTFGAAIAGSAIADVTKMGAWFKQALMPAKVPPIADRIATLVGLAEKARKEGLLALEAQVKDIDDPFLKRGLQMGIDGTDPEELRAVLEGEIAAKKTEDKVAAKFFNAMGGYAPTIGIIGTVVATLWGVLSANVFWLPMGAKITRISELQAAQMELLVEGITEIQAGTSPRAVRQKLTSLVPPSEVAKEAA